MELTQTTLEHIIKEVFSTISELSNNSEIVIIPDETKLVALCRNNISTEPDTAMYYENWKIVYLDSSFEFLSNKDKLLIIAATIKAHYQLTNGSITGYGDILNYELVNDSIYDKRMLFGVDGKIAPRDVLYFQHNC